MLVAVNGQYFSEHSVSTLNRNGKRSQQMLRSFTNSELQDTGVQSDLYDDLYDAELYKPYELSRNPNVFEQFDDARYHGILRAILKELLKDYESKNNGETIRKIIG